MEWKEVKVADIADLKNGKKRPSSKGDIPVYGGNGIMDYVDVSNGYNNIIIGRVGAYCGCVYRCFEHCWISDNAIAAKAKNGNDTDYIFYLLKGLNLNHHHIGGAQPLMTQDLIGRIEVMVPQRECDQRRIAAILSSLDRKIELNNKINAQLEEMAQAIFKNWFVDFEPFKDGKFVESELGRIPEGWRVGTLGEIASITSGKRPPMKQKEAEKYVCIPLVGAADVMGYTNAILYNRPILVIGRVGTHGVVQRWTNECWPSDNTLVIESPYYEFVYQILKRIDYSSINRGSTQPLITQTDVKNTSIVIPNSSAILEYEDIVSSLMRQTHIQEQESLHLAQLRDTLLPKLMSGEIELGPSIEEQLKIIDEMFAELEPVTKR